MKRFAVAAALSLLVFPAIGAQALSVDEIVQKANLASYYAGDDGMARAEMIIYDKQGRTREREFTILRKDKEDGGEQFYYVYFHRPGDVRKTVFLVHKYLDRDDDRWLYLPALDLVKRIAASDKRTSFVGSHFFYEDVSGRSPADDTHTLKEETDRYYVLDNVPKDPSTVEFAHYLVWIDKTTFLPMKAEYYDGQGKVYRRMEVLEVKEIQGIPTVTKAKMSDLNTGGYTEMTFKKIEYNKGIPDSIFTERYLRKPPRRYIRRR
ncbi:outer membrane lipoprotein-sorting protein [Deferrisoma camini]|uniref:outer membrane lipoprotein-sorting protein n=1 Tax=Deferrisoma camini TaxID=1035120 RepID=UPI00046C9116|nr:outer membrane lipoprotein-sorting protein [Deferrisoma camini]